MLQVSLVNEVGGGEKKTNVFPLPFFLWLEGMILFEMIFFVVVELKPLRSNIASSKQTAELNFFYQMHAEFSPQDPSRPWSASLAKPGAVSRVI